jgi:Meiotically up-regulated gene 113
MGNVYFVAADGAIKIGYSANVSKRMAQLQTGAACKLQLLAIFPGADRGVEKRLHEALSDHRLEGEWFRDVPTVRRFAEMVAGGARPVDLSHMRVLAEIARTLPSKKKRSRDEKVAARPITPIPPQFVGTPQGDLIARIDAMTRDPNLPISEYGRAHAALRKALKGLQVDISYADGIGFAQT